MNNNEIIKMKKKSIDEKIIKKNIEKKK